MVADSAAAEAEPTAGTKGGGGRDAERKPTTSTTISCGTEQQEPTSLNKQVGRQQRRRLGTDEENAGEEEGWDNASDTRPGAFPYGSGNDQLEDDDDDGASPDVPDVDVKAQVVSQEQQVREAFDIVQQKVQTADVIEMDDLLAGEAARHKRRMMAVLFAFFLVVIVTVIVLFPTVFAGKSDGFDVLAPNGRWQVIALNVSSACGSERDWFSDVTIEVKERLSDKVEQGTVSAVSTVGLRGEYNRINGTYDSSTQLLVIGPGSTSEAGGVIISTLILHVTTNTFIAGRDEWTWRDDEYPGGWGECANGTADIEMNRV